MSNPDRQDDKLAVALGARPPLPAGAVEECAAFQRNLKDRMSEGETEDRDIYLRMRGMILSEPDVHAVLGLSWLPQEQKWLYCIKTPFATWPKFVVGHTDTENLNPEILYRCGRVENAMQEFNEQNFGDHL
jgi:hypothetical protein